MSSRKRWLLVTVAIAVGLALVVAVVAIIAAAQRWWFSATAAPPGVGTVVVVPTQSKAQHALDAIEMDAAERAATEDLAAQPTAYWLTPEQDPPGTVGATVLDLIAQARDQDASLAVVVYGLPDRDCGNHSAGGLGDDDYAPWIDEIAASLSTAPDVQKIVVLEPDSLALAEECSDADARTARLGDAVDRLAGPHTWIYLDGGHSGWHTPARMAELINRVAAEHPVRGFATNVSNYRTDHDEFAYAHAVAEHLDGLHALIDTSRNGTAPADDQWCNPPGRTVGAAGGTFGDEIVDTNLWIKPPGESDGPCHGGPAAGVWWPEGAVELTRERG